MGCWARRWGNGARFSCDGYSLLSAVGLPSSARVYPTLFGNFGITPQLAAPGNLGITNAVILDVQ